MIASATAQSGSFDGDIVIRGLDLLAKYETRSSLRHPSDSNDSQFTYCGAISCPTDELLAKSTRPSPK